MMAESSPLYLIVRRNWRAYEPSGPFAQFAWFRDEDYDREHMGTPVEAFTDYASAQERHDELEREARQSLASPFQFQFIDHEDQEQVTSLRESELQDRILDMGIMPPEVRTEDLGAGYKYEWIDWRSWWNDIAESLSEDQRHAIWKLLDRLHFYEIVEMKLEE